MLTDLAEKKRAAAEADDLMTLNELLNQEQAQSLNFRGLELSRDKLLPSWGWRGAPGTGPPSFPPAMQEEARQAVSELQLRYAAYRQASGKTRRLLEQNSTRWRASLCRWAALPPAGRGDPATARSRKAVPRLRP